LGVITIIIVIFVTIKKLTVNEDEDGNPVELKEIKREVYEYGNAKGEDEEI